MFSKMSAADLLFAGKGKAGLGLVCKENGVVMYYARKKSPIVNGYHHFGQSLAGTKLVFHILYFHFQTKSKD